MLKNTKHITIIHKSNLTLKYYICLSILNSLMFVNLENTKFICK